MKRLSFPALLLLASASTHFASSIVEAAPVRLAHEPALSPDGKTVAFGWCGDIWTVPTTGGRAARLTTNPALDSGAAFSPDGKQIAFNSDREGSKQAYVMPVNGGEPKQITWNTDGCDIREWTPDGKSLLVGLARDFTWMPESRAGRLALIDTTDRRAEQILFDDYCTDGSVSPDGKKVLFIREGTEAWWRQGYKGSRAGQIWIFNREDGSFTQEIGDTNDARWPMWKADGRGFYFVSNRDGAFNLWEHQFGGKKDTQLTHFKGDSVVFPAISRDGGTIVFRVKFDLYRWHPGDKEPAKIDIEAAQDLMPPEIERVVLDKAKSVSFTSDGLQMAFTAGGDVWVMDTELKEPRQVTRTAEEERSVEFSPDGKTLLFLSDAQGRTDIWKATRTDEKKYWWENAQFAISRVTNDEPAESQVHFAADGKHIGYIKGTDLWMADADGQNAKLLVESWDPPSYEFSPDASWVVYSLKDEWFNEDVWVKPVDGSKPPFNLSRHPNNDGNPKWSPDGKLIAWIGRRGFDDVDIFYVHLREEDEEETKRERTLAKARDKIKNAGRTSTIMSSGGSRTLMRSSSSPTSTRTKSEEQAQTPATTTPTTTGTKPPDPAARTAQPSDKPSPVTAKPAETSKPSAPSTPASPPKAVPATRLDLEDIHERIHRVTIANSAEFELVWSPDSKKIAFHATVDGKRGTYSIEVPDDTKPKQLSSATPGYARWLKQDDQIVGLEDGKPASVSARPALVKPDGTKSDGLHTYSFRAQQSVDRAGKQRAVFDQCWQVMRDRFYDAKLGNKDWNNVRAKYSEMAAQACDMKGVAECVWLMLGELNGSHLGFTPEPKLTFDRSWREETAHLGLRFDSSFAGPGWKVRSVLPKGPASRKESRVDVGEVILKVDGKDVSPTTDVSAVLNGAPERDIILRVKSAAGVERDVTLRPISYTTARKLLYDEWIKNNRRMVETKSGGTLGYLHISAMNDESFQKFQEELYNAGAGKDGLIIDVRENGGGSTTDHLLTALTQPQHALTIPRGGKKPGYPQDRIVYATWNKPIVVMCNQNSYSNAEIFSHAIKTLKRGKVVGTPTAGGVISTGATGIMDVGTLRLPFRGWYGINDGADMELNGAKPDYIVWPKPGESAKGIDAQLDKAVEVLKQDVTAWKKRPQPKLIKATERGKE